MKNKFSNEVLISIIYAIFILPIFLLFNFGIIKSSVTLHIIYIIFTTVLLILSRNNYLNNMVSFIRMIIIYVPINFLLIYLLASLLGNNMDPLGAGVLINVLLCYNGIYFIIELILSYSLGKILKNKNNLKKIDIN